MERPTFSGPIELSLPRGVLSYRDSRIHEGHGLELVQGRPILESDLQGSPSISVVNEKVARTFWPSPDPLGKCFPNDQPGPLCPGVASSRYGDQFRSPGKAHRPT